MHILRLIRLPNLLMIILTQVLVRYCLILPAFETEYLVTGEYPSHLSTLWFSLLVLSTVLIAAAGYIINDYYDIAIDAINKPGKNVVGKKVNERAAVNTFYVLSAIGILAGFAVAFTAGKIMMGFVQVFAAVSLFMYSSHYKRRPWAGNILVAFLAALSLLVVGLFEPAFYPNFIYLTWYASFAFLMTLARELVKDMEDVDGDEMNQCKTLPVLYGIKRTRGIAAFVIILNMVLATYILAEFFYTNTVINFWMLLMIFLVPLVGLLYMVVTSSKKEDFHYASLFSKVVMLYGLLTMIPFYYYFLR